jgi:hypothetical protein
MKESTLSKITLAGAVAVRNAVNRRVDHTPGRETGSSRGHPPPGRDRAEGEEMSDPERHKEFEFSRRTIVLIILAMIAAAALTIEGTYLVLNAFVLHDSEDPLRKAGGLSSAQNADRK